MSRSAGQEFTRRFTKARYLLVPIIYQMKPLHALISYFFEINFNIIVPFTPRYPKVSGLPTKILYVLLTSPMRATYADHLNVLYISTLIIFGAEHKL